MRSEARQDVFRMHAITVTDGAGRATFAEIDDESGTTVLLPLDLDHVYRIGSDLPERHKLRCASHVAHEALLVHQWIEALLDCLAQFSCAAHAGVSKRIYVGYLHFCAHRLLSASRLHHVRAADWCL